MSFEQAQRDWDNAYPSYLDEPPCDYENCGREGEYELGDEIFCLAHYQRVRSELTE